MKDKIAIVIQHCLDSGEEKVFSTNEDYKKYVKDMRSCLKYGCKNSEILHMISFERDFWIMCCIKPDPNANSGSGYRAAWIFFPATLDLDKKEIAEVVGIAEKQIVNNSYDTAELNNLVDNYSDKFVGALSYNVPLRSKGSIAVFYINDRYPSLIDIYESVYQKAFTKYERVLLISKDSINEKLSKNLPDITTRLSPSQVISLKRNDFGFDPFYCGKEINGSIRIAGDDSISIEWRKKGYRPVIKNENKNKKDDFEMHESDCVKIIDCSKIRVVDAETHEPVSNPDFKFYPIVGKDEEKNVFYIKQCDLSNVRVTVSAKGYNSYKDVMNLTKSVLEIELSQEKHIYYFELELSNGKQIKTEEYISQFSLSDSPIPGYRSNGKLMEKTYNRLHYVGGNGSDTDERSKGETNGGNPPKIKQTGQNLMLWLGILVILGILTFIIYNNCSGGETSAEEESLTEDTTAVDKSTWDAAKNYLVSFKESGKNKWVKSEMDEYSKLNGLYDLINNYEFKEIVDFMEPHKGDYMQVDAFKRLYEKAKEYSDINKDGSYTDDDGEITINTYLKKAFSRPQKSEGLDDIYDDNLDNVNNDDHKMSHKSENGSKKSTSSKNQNVKEGRKQGGSTQSNEI